MLGDPGSPHPQPPLPLSSPSPSLALDQISPPLDLRRWTKPADVLDLSTQPWCAPSGPTRPIWGGGLPPTMRPEACDPWFWVGSATGLISVVTTLSVYSGCPLCLSRKCTSSPLLMSFSSSRNDNPWHPVVDWNSWATIYLFPLLSSSACDCKNYRRSHASDSSWLLFFALQPLVARTSLIVEQLVRGVRVYALKVTSLLIHTFFYSKQAFEAGFPNAAWPLLEDIPAMTLGAIPSQNQHRLRYSSPLIPGWHSVLSADSVVCWLMHCRFSPNQGRSSLCCLYVAVYGS